MAVITWKEDTITRIHTHNFINEDGEVEQRPDTECHCPIPCDAEPNGAAQTIMQADGKKTEYSYLVTLHANCPNFQVGERVLLVRGNGERKEGEVLGFHRYQLHAKLWL